jgi:Ras-related protein Rab-1A
MNLFDATTYDYLFKMILIGDSSCGKSSLLVRFSEGKFESSFISTIGIDFRIKTSLIEGKRIKLMVHDTSGQERFRCLTTSYYRGCHGVLLAYDVTSRESFNNLPRWLDRVSNLCKSDIEAKRDRDEKSGFVVLVAATKCDLDPSKHQVSAEEGRAFAASIEGKFVETSAKDGRGVDEAFKLLTKHCLWTAELTVRDNAPSTYGIPGVAGWHDDGKVILQPPTNYVPIASCCMGGGGEIAYSIASSVSSQIYSHQQQQWLLAKYLEMQEGPRIVGDDAVDGGMMMDAGDIELKPLRDRRTK